jgi:hypothetical protein
LLQRFTVSAESLQWMMNQWVGLVVTSPQTSHLDSCTVAIRRPRNFCFIETQDGLNPRSHAIHQNRTQEMMEETTWLHFVHAVEQRLR